MDIDPVTRPDVIADAWLPPFRANAFDVAILDPPYVTINQQMKNQLLHAAAFVAKDEVIWFHTMWIASGGSNILSLDRSWLVRVGDSCAVRCLQVFTVRPGAKTLPKLHFSRGPAVRYNRWLTGQGQLPIGRARDEETPETTLRSVAETSELVTVKSGGEPEPLQLDDVLFVR